MSHPRPSAATGCVLMQETILSSAASPFVTFRVYFLLAAASASLLLPPREAPCLPQRQSGAGCQPPPRERHRLARRGGLPAGLSPRLPPLCGGLPGSPRQRLAGVPCRRLSPRRSPRRGPRCQLAPAPSPLGILAPALEREGTECRTLGPWKLPHTDESPQGR